MHCVGVLDPELAEDSRLAKGKVEGMTLYYRSRVEPGVVAVVTVVENIKADDTDH